MRAACDLLVQGGWGNILETNKQDGIYCFEIDRKKESQSNDCIEKFPQGEEAGEDENDPLTDGL